MPTRHNMKKINLLMFIFTIIFSVNFVNVYAADTIEDGWYILPSLTDEEISNWAYYKDGKEEVRLSTQLFVRRGWGTAPDNSLISFKLVKEKGYYGVETDVRVTKDNVPVLSNDVTINKIARNKDLTSISETMKVNDLTLSEINNYAFVVNQNGEVLEKYIDNKITTFEEALVWAKENGMTYLIELQEGTKEQIKLLVDLTQKYDMDNHVVWISYYSELLQYVKEFDADENFVFICTDENKGQASQIFQSLKSENNLVAIIGVDGFDKLYSSSVGMPAYLEKYPISNYILETKPYVEPQIDTEEKVTEEKSITKDEKDNESNDTKVEVPNTNENISVGYKLIAFIIIIVGLAFTKKIKKIKSNNF